MDERVDVAVIGGGQAGLATSHELSEAGVEHVVLERARLGETWRNRWESFCLVTPNWTVRLPGHHYDGDDPDGFMPRDKIVAYLERYAAGFGAPVREGVKVTSLAPAPDGGFVLQTSGGELRAESVVVATGAYQRAHRPAPAASLPAGLLQLDADDFRSPAELPPGGVLVVGSGQSGCQLDLSGVGAVVFAGGFRPDYGWIDVPGAFDELGFPVHADGASTAANGLYFVGVHFLRKRQSSLLCGVGEDAALVAQHIAARST